MLSLSLLVVVFVIPFYSGAVCTHFYAQTHKQTDDFASPVRRSLALLSIVFSFFFFFFSLDQQDFVI